MGVSSSQIEPATQQSQAVEMPPPPRPDSRKRKRPSPASSIAGDSSAASSQLAHDLEKSAIESSQAVESLQVDERPTKHKKRTVETKSKSRPANRSKERQATAVKASLEPQEDPLETASQKIQPAQVVIKRSIKRKTTDSSDNGSSTSAQSPAVQRQDSAAAIGHDTAVVTEETDDLTVQKADISASEKALRNPRRLGPRARKRRENRDIHDVPVDSESDDEPEQEKELEPGQKEDNKRTAASKKPAKRKRKSTADAEVQHITKPDWLTSVPTTSSGTFTDVERNIADRVFEDFRQEHGLNSYALRAMIQNWQKEAGEFKAQIQAALPNRTRDAVRKFCIRRYHNMMSGPWTEDQDNDLRAAYLRWPGKWKHISGMVDRTAADCKDRWTKHLKFAKKNTGPWSVTETSMLYSDLATSMGVIVDHSLLGTYDELDFADPAAYLDAINWRIIEEHGLNFVRSAHQCREKFLRTWPLIVDEMAQKGMRPPFKKEDLVEHVGAGFMHERQKPSQVLDRSQRSDHARKALQSFEIGDYYDVFVEVRSSFEDLQAQYSDLAFWSVVGSRNVSRFSITWSGTTIRRIALETALADWPSTQRKLGRKLAKAETLQAKAHVLARHVEKMQQGETHKLKRTYKPELIGKSKDEIVKLKREARAQRHRVKSVRADRKPVSKDFVSDSEDEEMEQVPTAGADEEDMEIVATQAQDEPMAGKYQHRSEEHDSAAEVPESSVEMQEESEVVEETAKSEDEEIDTARPESELPGEIEKAQDEEDDSAAEEPESDVEMQEESEVVEETTESEDEEIDTAQPETELPGDVEQAEEEDTDARADGPDSEGEVDEDNESVLRVEKVTKVNVQSDAENAVESDHAIRSEVPASRPEDSDDGHSPHGEHAGIIAKDESSSEEATASESEAEVTELEAKVDDAKIAVPDPEASDSDSSESDESDADSIILKKYDPKGISVPDVKPSIDRMIRERNRKEPLSAVAAIPEPAVKVEQSSTENDDASTASSSASSTEDESSDEQPDTDEEVDVQREESSEEEEETDEDEDEKSDKDVDVKPILAKEVPVSIHNDAVGGAADENTDITVSSVNSRFEDGFAKSSALSPREFMERCKKVGRQQHAQFTAINAPPEVKVTYGNRRKSGF